MGSCSNALLAVINLITFLLSIPLLGAGIWLSTRGGTECEKFFQTPIIILGCFIMIISLIGFRGACCRSSGLLCLYLFLMMLLIVCLLCFTMFTLAVTNHGAGQALAGKGYKEEYRINDYSNWLKQRMSDDGNWSKIKSCLAASKICTSFADKNVNQSVQEFNSVELPSVQSGCCKPSDDCKFTYVQPTVWKKDNGIFNNPDCFKWDNNPETLCYNCQSCQAGLLDQLKGDWRKVAKFNMVILAVLILVFIIGCCASGHRSSSMAAARMQNPYLRDPNAPNAYAQSPYPPNPYARNPYPPNPYSNPNNPYAYKHLHP